MEPRLYLRYWCDVMLRWKGECGSIARKMEHSMSDSRNELTRERRRNEDLTRLLRESRDKTIEARVLIMVALCNRADHYIFILFLSFFLLLFFPRLISGVGDWMFTILRQMVWPWCEFRMQVWNALHAARCKYRTQKIAISAPSHNFVGPYLRN